MLLLSYKTAAKHSGEFMTVVLCILSSLFGVLAGMLATIIIAANAFDDSEFDQ